jgi:hypothetical protein
VHPMFRAHAAQAIEAILTYCRVHGCCLFIVRVTNGPHAESVLCSELTVSVTDDARISCLNSFIQFLLMRQVGKII